MIERQQEHAGAQTDTVCPARDRRQADQWRGMQNRIVMVLAEPHRIESRRFSALAFAQSLVETHLPLQRTQTDFHRRPLYV
jgi:hypothetical protein